MGVGIPTIARKSVLIATSQFFSRFIGWVGLVVLAKLWGSFAPEALGVIGFAMAFLVLFSFVADLGFSQAHVKRISEGKDLGSCIGTYTVVKIFLTILMIAAIFIVILLWKNIFNGGFVDATTESVVVVFIAYYIFANLQQIPVSTFQAKGEIAKRQIVIMSENIVKIPFMVFVAIAAFSSRWPPFIQPLQHFIATHAIGSLAMTYVLGVAASFLVGIYFLRKYPRKKPDRDLFKSYFSFALPILLMSVVAVISINIDKVMIGYFWTSVEVGYYFTVQQISESILVFSSAIGIVLFPTFSEYHSNKDIGSINKTTHLAGRYISMITMPIMVAVIVFVVPVINIMLSGAFLPSASVLVALMIHAFVLGVMMPYNSLVSGVNRPGITAKIGFTMCTVNIVLNYLFIPKWGYLSFIGINGPTGAAVATVLSAVIGLVGICMASKRLTGIKLLQRYIPQHISAGIVMAGLLYCMGLSVSAVCWYHLIAFVATGLMVYIGILFILGGFKKEDLRFFLGIIRPKKAVDYIRKEITDDVKE